MASIFLRPVLRPQMLGLGIGLSLATFQLGHQRPMKLDSVPNSSAEGYNRSSQTPLRNYKLNPRAVRQISSGSILGLCAGLAVSTFSRSLALLIGLLVVGVQWAASYGINVLPYNKLQRYVTNLDLRSALQDNVAFKLSFGTTFTAAAFMHF